MKGHAAKAAERCAMVAAIMHKFEGYEGPISLEVMRGAIRLVAWHLNQYLMRFCPLSQLELDTIELESCITRHAHKYAKTRSIAGPELCRYAPTRLRAVDDIWPPLECLQEQGKVKVWGHKGAPWSVSLLYWFPAQAWAQDPPPQSGLARRFWDNSRQAPAVSVEPQETGDVLWPGVSLP